MKGLNINQSMIRNYLHGTKEGTYEVLNGNLFSFVSYYFFLIFLFTLFVIYQKVIKTQAILVLLTHFES